MTAGFSGSALDTAIGAVELAETELVVRFVDGRIGRFNRFWLRDNCPSNGDRPSLFREFSVAAMPDDLTVRAAAAGEDGSMIVEFSDGKTDRFPAAFLSEFAGPSPLEPSCWQPWGPGHVPPEFGFGTITDGSATHHALLEAVVCHGAALVVDIPDRRDATEEMAAWLGPIRETDFGRVFDIVTEHEPFTPSQSSAPLDPHTDDPYRYSPSGASILHCLSPGPGRSGASTIVDGLAVAEEVANDDPEAFELLTKVAVPYVHRRRQAATQGAPVHLWAEAPVIALDRNGRVCGIRFHERSMAPLRLPAVECDRFYRALARFVRGVQSGRFTYRRRLEAGEAIIYDNQRVLHGREAIVDGSSRRHLRLCTIDRDQLHSRLRILRGRHAAGTEFRSLPAGNLS